MPYLELSVNIPLPAHLDEKAFALEFSKVSAEALCRPEEFFSVNINWNKTLTFGGTFAPAYALYVVILRSELDPDKNDDYSAQLSKFLEDKLGLPKDRGYVIIHDPGAVYLGYKGTTWKTLFKEMGIA